MTTVAFHADQLFFTAPGGIGTYIRELAPRLDAHPAVDVTLFHAAFDREPPEEWMREVSRHQLGRSIGYLYPAWGALGRPSLPRALGDLDLLHAPNPAAVPPPGAHQRLVVTVHDLAFRTHPRLFPPRWAALYRLGTRRAARRADAIIVPSRSTAGDLMRYSKADPERVHVVPLAASLPASETEPEETLRRLKVPRPFILFVGTLEPRKNLPRLVHAYRRAVATGGFRHALVLAGPMGWRSEALIRELRGPGPGEVILTGRASGSALDALYRSADLFVYPSLYEGFGLPVLEAMARGVPVITSTVSSLPEVAGEAAFTVNPESVPGLAHAIERLLADPAEADRLSRAGLARAGQFSWERTAEATMDVYRAILEG